MSGIFTVRSIPHLPHLVSKHQAGNSENIQLVASKHDLTNLWVVSQWLHPLFLVFSDTLFLLLDLWNHRQQICLVWSYAAVAQGSMWYGFRDALRRTLIVMWFSQLLSSHSPPMPDIKKIFSPRELALAGYLSLFLTILCKPQRFLWWESSGDQQFLKLSDRPVWHQQPCHIQRLLKQFFFPILMLSLSWPCLHA